MKKLTAVSERGACLGALVCACCAFILPAASRAAELYGLDFSAPDLGTYQVTAGSPSIQSMAGVLADALVFDAVSGGGQIRLPINTTEPVCEVQFDVLTHNLSESDYSFGVYLDTASVHALNFHGGLNGVYLYQSAPFLNLLLAPMADDSVCHFAVALDAGSSTWSVAVNGTPLYGGACDAAALQAIRFGISPWIGGAADAPGTYVALDNVWISAVPEPSVAGLAATGFVLWLGHRRRLFQTGR